MEWERFAVCETAGIEFVVNVLQLVMPFSDSDIDHIGNREYLDTGQFHIDRGKLIRRVAKLRPGFFRSGFDGPRWKDGDVRPQEAVWNQLASQAVEESG